jgi:hypothetical protein
MAPDGAMKRFRFFSSFIVPPSAFQLSRSALDAICSPARIAQDDYLQPIDGDT